MTYPVEGGDEQAQVEKIDLLLEGFGVVWKANPELRFGELLSLLLHLADARTAPPSAVFDLDDDRLASAVATLVRSPLFIRTQESSSHGDGTLRTAPGLSPGASTVR